MEQNTLAADAGLQSAKREVFPPDRAGAVDRAAAGPDATVGPRGTVIPTLGVFRMSFHAAPSITAEAISESRAGLAAGLDAEVRRLGRLAPFPAPPDRAPQPERKPARASSGLVAWRLKRVLAFMEEHYWEPVTLADMARVAGLSRMHFAAQFKVATGLRPHEFLLKRRIEQAQDLLRNTREPLVQIALAVGFQTQAHFTTVFRRFVGDTPYQWRCANAQRG